MERDQRGFRAWILGQVSQWFAKRATHEQWLFGWTSTLMEAVDFPLDPGKLCKVFAQGSTATER